MKRLFSTALVCLAAVTTNLPIQAQPAKTRPSTVQGTIPYQERSEAMELAADIATRRALPLDWVRATLGAARFVPQAARLMTPAPQGTPKNWNSYRSRFIDPVRIRAGVRFWQQHAATLARAEREYGVPAQIIVGIIGVETIYGQHMGNFRVLDALATLSFDFPAAHPRAAARTAYFRAELEQFLDLTHNAGIDPFSLRGSYAGAMGLGQFMPSSWRQWAVDFDGDGKIDLFASPVDAIGSVANYFVAHGWKPGLPTHYPVTLDSTPEQRAELLGPDIRPTFTPARMAELGVQLQGNGAAHSGPLALVELQNGGAAPLFIAGTENFYAITRYNWSSYYALSVIELGEEVRAARAATLAAAR